MIVGLRIDVDTLKGTRVGVPALVRALEQRQIRGSFFFSVGPDNMGRHLWRLLRPQFLRKMIRSKAASLYGWDILLRGALWSGPSIGLRLPGAFRLVADMGHEVGLHAWDHHAWQVKIGTMSARQVAAVTRRGLDRMTSILGTPPRASAAPGWRYNDTALLAQAEFPFCYQSDCRGRTPFLPLVEGRVVPRPQVPVSLPTYDELIGREGVTDANYNKALLGKLDSNGCNVLAIHAEVEGMSRLPLFLDFLAQARACGIDFVPLRELMPQGGVLPVASVLPGRVPGRAGWVACQGEPRGEHTWHGGMKLA